MEIASREAFADGDLAELSTSVCSRGSGGLVARQSGLFSPGLLHPELFPLRGRGSRAFSFEMEMDWLRFNRGEVG